MFASYNHGFRVPSQSQLFRPSATTSAAASQALVESALALQPIKAGQAEVGVRGSAGRLRYDVVVYEVRKRDDIVTLRDTATNFTQTVNAGRTRHRGIEAGLGVPVAAALEIDAALSCAKHEYRDWATANGDFSGNEIEAAPRVIGNVRLTWRPGADATVQLEWVKVGSYWLDAANTRKYGGHDVVNLRARWPVARHATLFGSIVNLADRRYADSASISSSTPVFSPGLPRTVYGGVELSW